jgi:hypothetical protein
VTAIGKKIVLLVVGYLLIVVMAGCGGHGKPAASISTPATPQNRQITTTQAMTIPSPATQNQAATVASEAERQLNQQIAGALYAKVKIPVLIPWYWPSIPLSNNQNPYCGIQYSAGTDSYGVTLSTLPEQLPVNSPELNMPPNDSEANQWGNFGGIRIGAPGVVAPNSVVVQQPEDGQPSAIGGYQGWQDQLSFYWESGAWQCEVQSPTASLMDDARELTGSFKEAGELQGLQAKSGKILMSDANHRYTFISWVSADGRYEYTLQYDGEIADAVRIANSFSEVKKE